MAKKAGKRGKRGAAKKPATKRAKGPRTRRTPKKGVKPKATKPKPAQPPAAEPAPKWRAPFLEALAEIGNVKHACLFAGVGRSTVYDARDRDEQFAAEWQAALDDAADVLEKEAFRRAVEGIKEPVYYQGQVKGHVQKYSDTLLIFLLKAARPEKFRERFEHDHAHHHTVSLETLVHEADSVPEDDEASEAG